mmetsp:Transcript_26609/g.55424  ORF Transcript_26609/g.55424 Transcript_26609/m.55424 type:complete len:372 (-) Transcript_26609:101-1216(-)
MGPRSGSRVAFHFRIRRRCRPVRRGRRGGDALRPRSLPFHGEVPRASIRRDEGEGDAGEEDQSGVRRGGCGIGGRVRRGRGRFDCEFDFEFEFRTAAMAVGDSNGERGAPSGWRIGGQTGQEVLSSDSRRRRRRRGLGGTAVALFPGRNPSRDHRFLGKSSRNRRLFHSRRRLRQSDIATIGPLDASRCLHVHHRFGRRFRFRERTTFHRGVSAFRQRRLLLHRSVPRCRRGCRRGCGCRRGHEAANADGQIANPTRRLLRRSHLAPLGVLPSKPRRQRQQQQQHRIVDAAPPPPLPRRILRRRAPHGNSTAPFPPTGDAPRGFLSRRRDVVVVVVGGKETQIAIRGRQRGHGSGRSRDGRRSGRGFDGGR